MSIKTIYKMRNCNTEKPRSEITKAVNFKLQLPRIALFSNRNNTKARKSSNTTKSVLHHTRQDLTLSCDRGVF